MGAVLAGANMHGAVADEADFSGADLTGAILGAADLTGANFTNAKLCGARLEGVGIEGAIFSGASLYGAVWSSSESLYPLGWRISRTTFKLELDVSYLRDWARKIGVDIGLADMLCEDHPYESPERIVGLLLAHGSSYSVV